MSFEGSRGDSFITSISALAFGAIIAAVVVVVASSVKFVGKGATTSGLNEVGDVHEYEGDDNDEDDDDDDDAGPEGKKK